jgi:hypothetical protein
MVLIEIKASLRPDADKGRDQYGDSPMSQIAANLHLIIPLAAGALFMAVVAFVSIEEAVRRR